MRDDALLVTGAAGFVGSSLLSSFALGRPRVGLLRAGRRNDPPRSAEGLTYRTVASWNESELARCLEGVGAVVHCASVVHHPNASDAEYERFNVEGTRALVGACVSAGVRRFVFMSTIKVYGEETVGVLDEATPVVGDTPYARTKIEAERVVVAAAAAGGLTATVLRLCPVYGKGDKGNVRAMIRAIAKNRFVLPGRADNRKSIVHVSSVCEVVSAAIDSPTTGTFVVADTEAPTMRDLANAIAQALGVRRPRSVPAPLLRAAASLVEGAARALGRKPPLTREQLRKLAQPTVCSAARVRDAFGVRCHVELVDALSDEVRWLRDSSLI